VDADGGADGIEVPALREKSFDSCKGGCCSIGLCAGGIDDCDRGVWRNGDCSGIPIGGLVDGVMGR
jgi:hypothetical protein